MQSFGLGGGQNGGLVNGLAFKIYLKRSLQTNNVKLVEYNPYLPNKGICQGGSGVKILVGGQWVGGWWRCGEVNCQLSSTSTSVTAALIPTPLLIFLS